jgi:very-short-patch-repair endonuclease
MLPYARHLKPLSRRLRSEMTQAEAVLWKGLRGKQMHGVQFYRQKPLGRFIADFYCAAARLVIEVDGVQHFGAEGLVRDGERDAFLEGLGLAVLRFSNRRILENVGDVLAEIVRVVAQRKFPRPPFPKGGVNGSR